MDFSTRKYRAFSLADARDTVPDFNPASRPCVRTGLPSAWFRQARQWRLRRGAGERFEGGGGGRGLRSSVEVLKEFFDHGWIFNAGSHLDRTAAVLAGTMSA